MNQKLKKEIKEWLEIIAFSAVGGLVVFHINSVLSPKTEKGTEPVKTEIVKTAASNDTIAQQTLNGVKQLKRQR